MGSVIMICTNSTDLYAKQPEKRGAACHQRALDRYVILHLVSTIIILLHLFIRGSKAHYLANYNFCCSELYELALLSN